MNRRWRREAFFTVHLAALLFVIELHWPLFRDQLGNLRWLATFLFFAPVYLWTIRSQPLRTAMTRLPLAALASWAIWALVSANWSNSLPLAFGLAFGMFTTVIAGAWYAGTYGWQRFAQTLSVAIAAFFAAGVVYRLGEGVVGRNGRFEGLAHGPTDAGRLGVVMAMTAMSGFGEHPRVRYGLAGLGCLACFGAGARTATLGLILGAILIAVRRQRKGRRRATVAALTLAVLTVGAILVSSGALQVDFASRSGEPEDLTSLTGRTEVWTTSLDASLDRPFTGFGLASSQAIFDELAADGIISWDPGTGHNLWLNNQLQLGMVGTVLLAAAIIGIVGATRRQPDHYRDALLLALLINSMTEPLLHEPAVALLVLAGMAGALSFDRPASRGDEEHQRAPARLVAVI